MAVELSAYVPNLRREVTPPGSELFIEVDDTIMTGYLVDGFWEARLDGFLTPWSASEVGLVPATDSGDELPRELVGLVILYAGVKILRNRLINLNTTFRVKGGPAEYEVQNSATLLTEALKQLKARKDQILSDVQNAPTEVYYTDAYAVRNSYSQSYYGLERHASYLFDLAA